MKRVILFISLVIGFSVSGFALSIDECKTDIYFGNGVWNSSEQAKESVVAKVMTGRWIESEVCMLMVKALQKIYIEQ